jgi:hypothetical protein
MLEYKGFKISGTSTPMYMEGCESRGSVFNPPEPVQSSNSRIEGKIFKTMKKAEEHGLVLARDWWTGKRKD